MSFPFIRQPDSKQCGVACLASICRHYGATYPLHLISGFCTTHSDGMSLLGLSGAARKLGFDTMCVSIPYGKVLLCDLPVILHWNQNHYVVLYKIKNGRFHVCDPAKGLTRLSEKEFRLHWLGDSDRGMALMLEPAEGFGKIVADGKDPGLSSLRLVTGYIRQYRRYLAQVFTGLLFSCLLQLALPFLTQAIVDTGIEERQIHLIWLILMGELLIVTGKTLTDFIRRWLLLHITMRVNVSLVSDFFIRLLSLPMSFFESKTLGDLTQRVGDHNRVQSFLTNQLLGSVFSFLSLLVFSAILMAYDTTVFAVFMVGSIIYAVWITVFLDRRRVIDYELFECEAINQSKTYQLLSAIQEIKLQDCKKRRRWEWEDTRADLFVIKQKSLKLQQAQEAGSVFINEIKNIIITVLSATSVVEGDLTLGGMMAIQYIIGQLASPVEQLMGAVYSWQDMRLSLERINEVHNARAEESTQGSLSALHGNGGIVFRDVTFKYDPYSPVAALDGVSVVIPRGKVTAIVGASGSGKTTMLKLMLGYYPPLKGRILVAGSDVGGYDLDWWRRQCGVVMQDGYIFTESIARNIAIDDGPVDRERLEYSCRVANIKDYVDGLPLSYDTIIGKEGTGLSQGQRQRILIARAVYKNPAFIFLDEATNSLDARNERAIVGNLRNYYAGKTVVIIAHRLSTVRDADQIIVLDKGKVVETGTHRELVANAGAYYNLVRNQLELGN